MDCYSMALGLLPDELRKNIRALDALPEEIRLRVGQPPAIFSGGAEIGANSRPVTETDLRRVLEVATDASLHRAVGDLRNGFVSYRGLRIGICGNAVMNGGEVALFSSYRSLNIRIPARFSGEIGEIVEELDKKPFENTLIVSPPGGGKTTLLRELIYALSSARHRLGVVDDRNELFPDGFETGEHTDILSGIDKPHGVLMLLRAMSPEIIALDEITGAEDAKAVREIAGCGVGLIATVHGHNIREMRGREMYRKLLDDKIFRHILTINCRGGVRSYALEE